MGELIADVESRFVVEYANAIKYYGVTPISSELQTLLEQVGDRFVIQYANSNRTHMLAYPVGLTGDATPPQISDVTYSDDGLGNVTIIWNTDEFADATVDYGTQPGVYSETESDPLYYRRHEVILPGLRIPMKSSTNSERCRPLVPIMPTTSRSEATLV